MFWIEISSHRLFVKLLRNSDFELLVNIVFCLIIYSIYRTEYNLGHWEQNKDFKIEKSQSFWLVTISSPFKSRWFCFRNLYDNLVLAMPHNEQSFLKKNYGSGGCTKIFLKSHNSRVVSKSGFRCFSPLLMLFQMI